MASKIFITVADGGAYCLPNQNITSLVPTNNGGNFGLGWPGYKGTDLQFQDWFGATVGNVLTIANQTQATWQPGFVGGDDLAGSTNTFQVVVSVSGTGTSPYTGSSGVLAIKACETQFYATPFGQAHLDSFMIDETTGGTGSIQTIYSFPAMTAGTMDAAVTYLCVDFSNPLNVYRADLTFTALASGGALNTILQSGNPQNQRSNGTLSGVNMSVVQSGNIIQIKGTFPGASTTKMTGYFRLQWRQ